MYSFSDKIFFIDTCCILFQYSWLIRDVKDSVQNILKKLQEYMIRQSRTSSEAAAFKYESRFELRITQLISSLYWPLYFFRFVCVNWLDSLCKVPRLLLKKSFSSYCSLLMTDLLVCSMALYFFDKTEIFESTGVYEIPTALILDEVINFTCPCILRIIENQISLGGMLCSPRPIVKQPIISWYQTFFCYQASLVGRKTCCS